MSLHGQRSVSRDLTKPNHEAVVTTSNPPRSETQPAGLRLFECRFIASSAEVSAYAAADEVATISTKLLPYQNADRVVAQGAGVLVPPGQISAARLAAEVERVSGPSFRVNAARLATKLRACGGLERALSVIESAPNTGARASTRSSSRVAFGQHSVR
jgi:hypothetical protein